MHMDNMTFAQMMGYGTETTSALVERMKTVYDSAVRPLREPRVTQRGRAAALTETMLEVGRRIGIVM